MSQHPHTGQPGYQSRSSGVCDVYSHPLERWERRLCDAKKRHRPRLSDWERGGFGIEGSRAAEAFQALAWDAGGQHGTRGMPRERRDELSREEFWEHYERRRLPVLVTGIPSYEGWRAGERWTFERLDRRLEFEIILRGGVIYLVTLSCRSVSPLVRLSLQFVWPCRAVS